MQDAPDRNPEKPVNRRTGREDLFSRLLKEVQVEMNRPVRETPELKTERPTSPLHQ